MQRRRLIWSGVGIAVLLCCLGFLYSLSANSYISINGVVYRVVVADTPALRQRGLMFETHLPARSGMLFEFDRRDFHVFWMKNTPLSLDMIWMTDDFKIVDLHENAVPYSESLIVPSEKSHYVLELNAGEIKAHQFKRGMGAKAKSPLLAIYYFFQK